MYTLHEAAEYLGKSYNSVLRMAIRKNIERTKKGRYTYIKESDLESLTRDALKDACCPGNPRSATFEDVLAMFKQLM